MDFTINSKKLGKPVTFFCPSAGGYVYVDLNGKTGTLGHQICKGGKLVGATLRHECKADNEQDNQAIFKMLCRAWFRGYLRELGLYNTGVYFDDTI